MHSKKCLLILPFIVFSIVGCNESDEAKAKRIYEDSSLTKKERIDRLYGLYIGSYDGHGSFNKTASDRAWDAIVNGDYDKAYSITQGYENASYNHYALYYAELLQEPAPAPNSVRLKINKSKFSSNQTSTKYYLNVEAPELDNNFPVPGVLKNEYKGYLHLTSDTKSLPGGGLFDTGNKNYSQGFFIEGNMLTFKISVITYLGWSFSYYNQKGIYEYRYTFYDPQNIGDGDQYFECEYIGMRDNILFPNG